MKDLRVFLDEWEGYFISRLQMDDIKAHDILEFRSELDKILIKAEPSSVQGWRSEVDYFCNDSPNNSTEWLKKNITSLIQRIIHNCLMESDLAKEESAFEAPALFTLSEEAKPFISEYHHNHYHELEVWEKLGITQKALVPFSVNIEVGYDNGNSKQLHSYKGSDNSGSYYFTMNVHSLSLNKMKELQGNMQECANAMTKAVSSIVAKYI